VALPGVFLFDIFFKSCDKNQSKRYIFSLKLKVFSDLSIISIHLNAFEYSCEGIRGYARMQQSQEMLDN
jgi:hypothetical protein